MVEKAGNVNAIRNFMIKSMKKYMEDMELMKNIVLQNPDAFSESKDDILYQFNQLRNNFKAVIDYNFYPVEIEAVEKLEKE